MKLYEGVRVEGVAVQDGRVVGVKTNKGDVECEIFVNCAGQVCMLLSSQCKQGCCPILALTVGWPGIGWYQQ